jgi:hypothetical protein
MSGMVVLLDERFHRAAAYLDLPPSFWYLICIHNNDNNY